MGVNVSNLLISGSNVAMTLLNELSDRDAPCDRKSAVKLPELI